MGLPPLDPGQQNMRGFVSRIPATRDITHAQPSGAPCRRATLVRARDIAHGGLLGEVASYAHDTAHGFRVTSLSKPRVTSLTQTY